MIEVRTGWAAGGSEVAVAGDLARQAYLPGAQLALVFASPHFCAGKLASELQRGFGEVPVYGCTTAGEISERGFTSGSAVAMTIKSERLQVGFGLSTGLGGGAFVCGQRAAEDALAGLVRAPTAGSAVVTIVDGRSGQEESFVAAAAAGLSSLPLVGGSASVGLNDDSTPQIFCRGEAVEDAGLVMVFDTDLPTAVVVSENAIPLARRVVVTASDPVDRLVHELDGRPAREVFAELYDLDSQFTAEEASRHPFAYCLSGTPYIRSVMGIDGNSLRFACAVADGVILRPTRSRDLVESTAADLAACTERLGGKISALIAFNCLGRYLDSKHLGCTEELGTVLAQYPIIGFNTFGEQVGALHVNHTLTSLAIGA